MTASTYSHNSGSTQWEDPRDHDTNQINPLGPAEHDEVDEVEDLPEGWEQVKNAEHGVFYVE